MSGENKTAENKKQKFRIALKKFKTFIKDHPVMSHLVFLLIGCGIGFHFGFAEAGKKYFDQPGSFMINFLFGSGIAPLSSGIIFTAGSLYCLFWAITHKERNEFCLKAPTLIGMLGTLYSLIRSDLTNPETLSRNFSIAIVSTAIGIIVYLLICAKYSYQDFLERKNTDAADGKKEDTSSENEK